MIWNQLFYFMPRHDAACQVKDPFKDATSKDTASNG